MTTISLTEEEQDTTTPEPEGTPDAAKVRAFRRYSRLMSDNVRARRAEQYPNPEAMDLKQFLADCREEANIRGWCSTAQSYVRQLTVRTSDGKDTPILCRHPQWNPDLNDYDQWSAHPRILADGITTIPTADVLAKINDIIRGGYGDESFRVGMDNILARQFVTYTPPVVPTFKVTLEQTITGRQLREAQRFISADSPADEIGNALAYILQSRLNRNHIAWEIVPEGS